MLPIALLAAVFVPMLLEARRAARHDRALRAAGAIEPQDDVYKVMQVAYPLAFLLPIGEAWLRGSPAAPLVGAGAVIFAIAKAIKYWAIASLGPRWTYRVLVPPASTRIVSGPYRFVRHPNYVGVAGELVGVALMAGAIVTGPIAVLGFTALMLARIRVEERALGLRRG
jgi:methyltransferase